MRHNYWFIIIFLLALFLRFYQLSSNPPSLNWDEVSHGYNAYSLLNTGKDQWGVTFPFFNFRAYGDYPMVLNLYLTIPSIIVFGLNEFSIRFPSALFGTALVVVSYFLGKIFFSSKREALLLMFLVAISPWTILPSRAVFQSNSAQFFLVLGLTLFLYSVSRFKPWLLFFGLLTLAVSSYGYHNTRIFVPLFFPILILFYQKEIKKLFTLNRKVVIISFLIFLTLTLFQLSNLFSGDSRARSKWVFAIDEGAIGYINERRSSFGNSFLGRVVYNKGTYLIVKSASNFASYLWPDNLFFKGGTQYQFSIPNYGVLYSLWMPFFYLGLLLVIIGCYKREKNSIFLVFWLIIGLVPAIITKDSFQVIRATTILPLPMIFIVIGIKKLEEILSGKEKISRLVIGLFIGGSLVLLGNYWRIFWTSYRQQYSWAWQYGYKETVNFIKANYQNYDKIYVTKKYGEPHEFVLFYWPWNPQQYLNDPNLKWNYHADWYWVDGFDKFIFINDWEMIDKLKIKNEKLKILAITSPENYPDGWNKLKTINFLDGKPAFEILEK
jgi:4-amino-4-deoxy-L-arabinose transferase-like glycosyltransferase